MEYVFSGANIEQNKLVQEHIHEQELQNRAREHGIFLLIITIGLDHKSTFLYSQTNRSWHDLFIYLGHDFMHQRHNQTFL
jgi:tryptophanyl-tRNA synthetase